MTTWAELGQATTTWSDPAAEDLALGNHSFENIVTTDDWYVYAGSRVYTDATWERSEQALAYRGNYILRPVLQKSGANYRGSPYIRDTSQCYLLNHYTYRVRVRIRGTPQAANSLVTARLKASQSSTTLAETDEEIATLASGWQNLDAVFTADSTVSGTHELAIRIYCIADDANTVRIPFWIDYVTVENLSRVVWATVPEGVSAGWAPLSEPTTSWADKTQATSSWTDLDQASTTWSDA